MEESNQEAQFPEEHRLIPDLLSKAINQMKDRVTNPDTYVIGGLGVAVLSLASSFIWPENGISAITGMAGGLSAFFAFTYKCLQTKLPKIN